MPRRVTPEIPLTPEQQEAQESGQALFDQTIEEQAGQFVLDPAKRTLARADSTVFLTPEAFDVLLFLAQNPNRLVTKEELLQAVWGATFETVHAAH